MCGRETMAFLRTAGIAAWLRVSSLGHLSIFKKEFFALQQFLCCGAAFRPARFSAAGKAYEDSRERIGNLPGADAFIAV
jgi:hypothetical protein